MDNTIRKAFSEVYDVLNNLQDGLYEKIPEKFIKLIEENRDKRICCKHWLFKRIVWPKFIRRNNDYIINTI